MYLDVVILIVLLAITGYAVFKKRSRSIIISVSLFSLVYFGFFKNGCVCSVGSIQNVVLALLDSSYKVPVTVVLFFIIPIIVSLFWGRLFCAGACPLGAIQDALSIWRIKLPEAVENTLRMLPPFYLITILIFLLTKGVFLICQYDPFVSIFRMDGTVDAIVLTIAFVLIAMIIPRPYCRFICPYGYLLKLAAFISPNRIQISAEECRSCRLCYEVCPVEAIEPAKPPIDTVESVKRVKFLIKMIPLWIVLFSWGTMRLINFLTDNGESTESLIKAPLLWSIVLGVIMAVFWGGTLIFQSRGRIYNEAFPHRSDCIRCARCYNYCPVEGEKRSIERGE